MMPDPHMKSKLVSLVTALDEREQGGLKGLDIICQVSIHQSSMSRQLLNKGTELVVDRRHHTQSNGASTQKSPTIDILGMHPCHQGGYLLSIE